MLAIDWTTTVLPLVILAVIALAVVVWLLLTRVFTSTRAGRHASHFLDVGDADMSPEEKVKHNVRHPGSGGTI